MRALANLTVVLFLFTHLFTPAAMAQGTGLPPKFPQIPDDASEAQDASPPETPESEPVTFDEDVTAEDAEVDDSLDAPADAPVEILELPADTTLSQRIQISEDFLLLGEIEQALSLWEDVPGEFPSKLVVYDKALSDYRTHGEHAKVLKVLLLKRTALIESKAAATQAVSPVAVVENDVVTLIQTQMQEEALRQIVQDFGPAFPADVALLRLIALHEGQGDTYRTAREIKRFTSVFPQHAALPQVSAISERMRQRARSSRHRIGALFQTTGDSAAFSDSALKGVQLAVQQFRSPEGAVGLIVKEWEGQSAGAPEALKRWIAEDRPIALVGPLLSKEVNRAAPIVEAAGLALITPGATAPTLASLGKSVIRNASTGRAQCQALVQHALSRMRRFAILFPKTPRNEEWANCFSEQIKAGGGEVLYSASYPPGETDFAGPIRQIKNAETQPDAIFLPGDARTVGLLIPQLTFHGVVGLTLLGTNDWNHPQFLTLAGRHAEGARFADGFFPESPDAAVRQFVEQYRAKYQQTPDMLAAQAYDAARLILTAIENGAVTPQEVRAALLSTTQFSGASGQILEMRNGEAVKQPLMIEVRRGRFVQAQ